MNGYHNTAISPASRGITMNSLKEQMHSLNMRMLLAMQNHNEDAQADIKKQMAEIQAEIDCMNAGGRKQSR